MLLATKRLLPLETVGHDLQPARSLRSNQFNWRHNLLGVWIALFAIQFGYGFCAPYVALYLYRDFSVHDPGKLALFTGLVAGSVSLSASLASPIWGVLGDRFGRRPMLLRAISAAGITIVASGLAPSVGTLVASRVAMGLTSGVNPAGTAVVAEGTPPTNLSWALGLTSSARAIGQAVGPMAGALLASFLPLRIVFVFGGLLVLLALAPVALIVHEPTPAGTPGERGSVMHAIRGVPSATARTIVALWACLGLVFLAVTGMQQLIVLRILSLHIASAAFTTGLAFTVFGISTALAATQYSRLIHVTGFKALAATSAALLACAIILAAIAPTATWLVVCSACAGLTFGAVFPTLNSMLGLESPARIKATVFGLASSFTSLGNGVGPLAGGAIAAVLGLGWGLGGLAVACILAGLLVVTVVREPAVNRVG